MACSPPGCGGRRRADLEAGTALARSARGRHRPRPRLASRARAHHRGLMGGTVCKMSAESVRRQKPFRCRDIRRSGLTGVAGIAHDAPPEARGFCRCGTAGPLPLPAPGSGCRSVSVPGRRPRTATSGTGRNSSPKLAILPARLPQGRRRGFVESPGIPAHGVQPPRMRVAVPLTAKTRVGRDLIHGSSPRGRPATSRRSCAARESEPGQRRLSPESAAARTPPPTARPPGIRGTGIGIRDDDEVGPPPSPDGSQFGGIPCSDPLFPRLGPDRKRKGRNVMTAEIAPLQEPPHECVRLRVLAQQRDVDSTHFSPRPIILSQPRIIASDRDRSSTVWSG